MEGEFRDVEKRDLGLEGSQEEKKISVSDLGVKLETAAKPLCAA